MEYKSHTNVNSRQVNTGSFVIHCYHYQVHNYLLPPSGQCVTSHHGIQKYPSA